MLNLITLLTVGYISITPNYDIGRLGINELCKISSGSVIHTEIDEDYIKHVFINGKDGMYEVLKKQDDNKYSLESIITSKYDYLINVKYLPMYWMYFEDLKNLYWEGNICEPNVSQEEEIELKTNYLTSYISNLYKKKPRVITRLKTALESIDLSKYSEKTRILTEFVKKIIEELMR